MKDAKYNFYRNGDIRKVDRDTVEIDWEYIGHLDDDGYLDVPGELHADVIDDLRWQIENKEISNWPDDDADWQHWENLL